MFTHRIQLEGVWTPCTITGENAAAPGWVEVLVPPNRTYLQKLENLQATDPAKALDALAAEAAKHEPSLVEALASAHNDVVDAAAELVDHGPASVWHQTNTRVPTAQYTALRDAVAAWRRASQTLVTAQRGS